MAKREYPKVMIANIQRDGRGDALFAPMKEAHREIVWNKTEYDSFVAKLQPRFRISEKKPKWRDLKGMNVFKRI